MPNALALKRTARTASKITNNLILFSTMGYREHYHEFLKELLASIRKHYGENLVSDQGASGGGGARSEGDVKG